MLRKTINVSGVFDVKLNAWCKQNRKLITDSKHKKLLNQLSAQVDIEFRVHPKKTDVKK